MSSSSPPPPPPVVEDSPHTGNGDVIHLNDSNPSPVADNKDGEELTGLYKRVLKFYKDNEGKSAQIQYHERLRLVSFTQQVTHGKFSPEKVPPLGALDVIGKDRRNAWIGLGDMDKTEAMRQFVAEVTRIMPHLQPFLEAHQKVEEQRREDVERERLEREERAQRQLASLEVERLAEAEGQRQEDQRRQIQDALNRQTFAQFKSYAEQQFPNNPDQQAVLIRQLQEQHYYQYMQQIYQQQMETHAKDTLVSHGAAAAAVTDGLAGLDLKDVSSAGENDDDEEEDVSCDDDLDEPEDVTGASMWTKKEIADFKTSIRSEGGDAIIKVGHGETVTIRVPTHEDGSALFWEFATDSYDIAFGLFFEWSKTDEETEVSVHISDSEDEDVDEEEEDGERDGDGSSRDPEAPLVERGGGGPPTSVVVPIYRRDCHQEVYAGTHQYPGPGVYLLKFDNTYSLWRSKTLYYRVYYTR